MPTSSTADGPPVSFIFVTGGVTSSLGKGIVSASLGRLLEARGLRVTIQKFDPYLNVDAGTMNPYEHGEVFVTDDGAETDLDLGPLRALPRRADVAGQQRHDGPRLLGRHRQGAGRRVPRQDRPDRPARHRRDQGLDAPPRRDRRLRRHHHGDRRDRGRHRVAAVPRGDPPDLARGGPRAHGPRPPHARAVPRRGRRAQDQADAALGQDAPELRLAAGRPRVPLGVSARRRHPPQDRPLLQRRAAGGRGEPRRRVDLRGAAPSARAEAGRGRP